MNRLIGALMMLGVLCCLVGCSNDSDIDAETSRYTRGSISQQLAERGAAIFKDKNFGEVSIACEGCHNEYPDSLQTSRIMPGHSILGAADRRETWYGEFSGDEIEVTAAGAAKCAFIYQLRGNTLEDALSPDESSALMEYFRFIATGNESQRVTWEALSYPGDPYFEKDSIVAIVDSLNDISGDPVRGEELFQKACAFCHSNTSEGIAPPPRRLRRYASKIFLYVRAGKSNMPFFSYDKLSDQDIADIKEWIRRGAR